MNKKIANIVIVLTIIGLIIFGINAYKIYSKLYISNVKVGQNDKESIYIPTNADFETVIEILENKNIIKDIDTFKWVAEKMNYQNKVMPGRYIIKKHMSNKAIIEMLRSGLQTPVKVTFNNIKTIEQFAEVVSEQIEADQNSLMKLFTNKNILEERGFNENTIIGGFIPNTYEFYWNTSAEKFFEKMQSEYRKYWNADRIAKAQRLKLTPVEISILASIVEEETQKRKEMPVVAGVYLNRLRIGMRLQADPTVRYLIEDTIYRVLKKHLEIESPYNTYLNAGLPPGPIRMPSTKSIDAVLGAQSHKYIYFCAKEDFSGYHNFASTLAEHNRNARLYQQALNRRKIMK